MEKLDYKKLEKDFYFPKGMQIVEVPKMKFITVDGKGAPSSEAFQNAVGGLYTTAFTIAMSYRSGDMKIDDFENFVVPPLEGLWTWDSEGDADWVENPAAWEDKEFDKDKFVWRIMIRMPDFVTEDVVNEAIKLASEKKKTDFSFVQFSEITDGLCLHTIHIGDFDSEGKTFQKMYAYAAEKGYKPVHKEFNHREIYLSDFSRTKPENLKTLLRIYLEKI